MDKYKMVKLDEEIHRSLKFIALAMGQTLQELINQILYDEIQNNIKKENEKNGNV